MRGRVPGVVVGLDATPLVYGGAVLVTAVLLVMLAAAAVCRRGAAIAPVLILVAVRAWLPGRVELPASAIFVAAAVAAIVALAIRSEGELIEVVAADLVLVVAWHVDFEVLDKRGCAVRDGEKGARVPLWGVERDYLGG